jgi:hypothetical protein
MTSRSRIAATPARSAAVLCACAGRAAWGTLLITVPGWYLAAGRGRDDRTSRAVLRVLGARHLVQAAVVATRPSRPVLDLAVGVDVAHAVSAVAFASVDGHQRRIAWTEATVASSWAVTGWLLRRSA